MPTRRCARKPWRPGRRRLTGRQYRPGAAGQGLGKTLGAVGGHKAAGADRHGIQQ
jgi:hypothetical protein